MEGIKAARGDFVRSMKVLYGASDKKEQTRRFAISGLQIGGLTHKCKLRTPAASARRPSDAVHIFCSALLRKFHGVHEFDH